MNAAGTFDRVMRLTRRRLIIAVAGGRAALPGQQPDGSLHDRVQAKLNRNTFLRIRALTVEVTDGVVTIRGIARSAKVKSRATKVAAVKGVKRVVNLLVVGG